MTCDYSTEYDTYWASEERFGEQSFADADAVAEEILLSCGGGKLLDIGSGMGQLVCSFLSLGVDAHGLDVSQVAVNHANTMAPNRFHLGSVIKLPFETNTFDTVVSTDCLEHLAEQDVCQALNEIRRVARRAVYLRIATTLDRDGHWHLTVKPRTWWEQRFFEAGFRKHPSYYRVNGYEALQDDGWQVTILLECIPDTALALYPLDALLEERDLHMDMLRETGARSDAHVARYQWATHFVRPGDTVLDAACGLGYGSYLIQTGTMAARTLGIDGSAYAVDYATANFGTMVSNLKFQAGMLPEVLRGIPDHSIDVVISFETLEHIDANKELLVEFHRVLTPAGRLITSVPNDWSDETGEDPNPFHLHVYTLDRLRAELDGNFTVEKLVAQSASRHKSTLARKNWIASGRSMKDVPPDIAEGDAPDTEWWLAVAMRSPLEGRDIPYRETEFPTYNEPNWNVTTFGRDYQNPWLLRGMVNVVHRLQNKAELADLAKTVCQTSEPDSSDVGAALCVLAYQLLSNSQMRTANAVESLSGRVDDYINAEPKTPHGVRWTVSLNFVLGKLWMATGDFSRAVSYFENCVAIDPFRFSPLLCNRSIEARLILGSICIASGDKDAAAVHWKQGIAQAQQAVTADWRTSLGDPSHPAEFSLPELASILEYASACAFALVNLEWYEDKPWWWLHPRRDRQSESSRRIKALDAHIGALTAAMEEQSKANVWLASQRDAWETQAKALDARIRELTAAMEEQSNKHKGG